ncbi:MAG TPA: hypothetical protein VGH20_19130 [Myxococcales bacterium]
MKEMIQTLKADLAALERAYAIMQRHRASTGAVEPKTGGHAGHRLEPMVMRGGRKLKLRDGSLNARIIQWMKVEPLGPKSVREVSIAMNTPAAPTRSALVRLVEGGWLGKTNDSKYQYVPETDADTPT